MASHYELYFHNRSDKTVTFILFHENEILESNSYSVVWYKHTAQKGEKVGPLNLSSEIYVSINSGKPGILLYFFKCFINILFIFYFILFYLYFILFNFGAK